MQPFARPYAASRRHPRAAPLLPWRLLPAPERPGLLISAALLYPDVANQFAVTRSRRSGSGNSRPKLNPRLIHLVCVGGEDKHIARSLREREVVGDGVHLVDELVDAEPL